MASPASPAAAQHSLSAAPVDFGFIHQAPASLHAWTALFDHASLPVLASTAQTLEDLRRNEDAVDAHLLAETLADDPLMTLKLLAHVAQMRRSRAGGSHGGWHEGGDAETVTEALVMLGISPFFRAFGPQASIEDLLGDDDDSQQGFAQVLHRARRAARFAMGFAVHRMDHDAAVIREAALLHDVAELLLWLRAPRLALQLQRRQNADATLRSSTVQVELLHIELADLDHALMQAWHLPRLLVKIADTQSTARDAQMRNVELAIRIARHSTLDWDNAALRDDVRELGELLNLAPDTALRLLRDIDED